MIIQSLITLIILQIITLIAIIIGIKLTKVIPPKEMYLLVLCLLLEFLSFFLYSFTYLYSNNNDINSSSIIYSRIGYFISQCAIMVITYALLLIDFKNSYLDFFEILSFSWIGMFNATYNAMTFDSVFSHGSIQSIYTPFGQIFIIIFLLSVIVIWVRRFLNIIKIYGKQGKGENIFRSLLTFIIIGIIFMSTYVILVVVYKYEGNLTFIMSGLFTIVGTVALVKNHAFLFVTDIKLDSINIIDKKSSLILYSKAFEPNNIDDSEDPDFLGSIITAINVSMSNTIKSHRELAEMNFSDKTVLIYSGNIVNSIVIVSSANLIVKSLSPFIAKRFEKMFGDFIQQKIDKNIFYSRKKDFLAFDKEVEYIRKFLPI